MKWISIMPFLGRFAKKPKTNTWLIRQDDLNSYMVIDKKNKKESYKITLKTAATRSHYFISEGDDIVAEIEQAQLQNKYTFKIRGEEIGTLNLTEDKLILDYLEEYEAKPNLRAKEFDFNNKAGELVFTIDKTSISLKDKYKIVYKEAFNALLPILVTICIDDFYHHGLSK